MIVPDAPDHAHPARRVCLAVARPRRSRSRRRIARRPAQAQLSFRIGARRPVPADADRHRRFRGRRRPRPAGLGRHHQQPAALGLFRAARQGAASPSGPPSMPRRASRPGGRAGVQALVTGRVGARRLGPPQGRVPALGRRHPASRSPASNTSPTPTTGAAIGHIISDAVYTKITGVGGFFDTRIVFVDESGPKENRRKRLAIMDQDGANVRYLTQGDNLGRDAALLAGHAGHHLHVAGRRASSRASRSSTSRPAAARSSATSPT